MRSAASIPRRSLCFASTLAPTILPQSWTEVGNRTQLESRNDGEVYARSRPSLFYRARPSSRNWCVFLRQPSGFLATAAPEFHVDYRARITPAGDRRPIRARRCRPRLPVQARHYYTVDYPGADDTKLRGIDNWGRITGNFTNYSDGIEHGFIKDARGFHQVDYPGSTSTDVSNINDFGVAVGDYSDPDVGNVHAFCCSAHSPASTSRLMSGNFILTPGFSWACARRRQTGFKLPARE